MWPHIALHLALTAGLKVEWPPTPAANLALVRVAEHLFAVTHLCFLPQTQQTLQGKASPDESGSDAVDSSSIGDAKQADQKETGFTIGDATLKLDPQAYKESMQTYLSETHDLYEKLFTGLLTEQPEDPVKWAITWLSTTA